MTAPRISPPLVLVLVVALGRLAGAQPASPAPDDRAKAADAAARYDEGKRHFDIGEYAQAIASWKQSYLLSSAPLLLFNIAQAYRLSGNCAQANRFYLNYRRVEKHPKNQAELDKAMARCAGVQPATGDAAGEPASSAAATGTTPTAGATSPAPTADPDVATGRTPTTEQAPAPTTAPAARPAAGEPPPGPPATAPSHVPPGGSTGTEPPNARRWRIAGLVTGAVGAAAVAAGGIYVIAAKLDSDTVSDSRIGTPYTGDVAATDRSGQTAASRARVLAGVGAALAVAGGVMWYIGHRQGAQLDVAIAPGHAEVALSCAF